MANYAKDSDLDKYDANVRKGVDTYIDQLTFASDDILNLIKTAWWPEATGLSLISFDEARLNVVVLEKVTVYKAFYEYIYPLKSKFTEGDSFLERIEFYEARFKDEWIVVKGLPIYDFDDDSSFDDDERRGPIQRRLARG